jgi:ATP-dependent RNA helicase RhlE
MPFASLGLADNLVRAVAAQGYTVPTPIQSQVHSADPGGTRFARLRSDRHRQDRRVSPCPCCNACRPAPKHAPRLRLVQPGARPGADADPRTGRPSGRKRAQFTVVHAPIRTTVLVGGVSLKPQCDALRRGVDLLVATPGRLLDHVSQRNRRPVQSRNSGPGRSRPDAGHGLHPGDPAHPGPACPSGGKTCCFRPRCPRRSASSPANC